MNQGTRIALPRRAYSLANAAARDNGGAYEAAEAVSRELIALYGAAEERHQMHDLDRLLLAPEAPFAPALTAPGGKP